MTDPGEKYPLYSLLIEITKKCNAACDQCGSRCDIHTEETLPAQAILAALQDIKEHIGVYTMLNITGGEPLLRRDLFEIMTKATQMGFEWGMVTNGSLITPDTVQKMKASGLKTVTISMDGLRETHDSLRHLPGGWDRILTALKLLKEAAFLEHLQITFTANRRNVYEFEELYRIVSGVGIDSVRVSFMDPIGRAREHTDLLLTREEILYLTGLANRLNREKRGPKIIWGCPHYLGTQLENRRFFCFAGMYNASVLANGDIFVCPNVERRPELIQGNILTDSFSEVWKNGFRCFRERTLPEKCKPCPHKNACRGDSMHTWDFDTDTPRFCYRDFMEAPDAADWKRAFFDTYKDLRFYEVSDGEKDAFELILEPEAMRDIGRYFHIGRAQPQSMYEQQMALIGFTMDNVGVVRYAIPCDGLLRAADNAIFTNKILKTVDNELKIINNNYYKSADRVLPGSECDNARPMKFLGFIHSHPTQSELQYSVGDDDIHARMLKKFGAYVGVLVNPAEGTMGAYYGTQMRQAKLILPEV